MLILVRNTEGTIELRDTIDIKKAWYKIINLKEVCYNHKTLMIVDLYKPCSPIWNITVEYEYSLSLLKSNLQKTIRRKEDDHCYATLLQFLKQNPIEALRRIAIILLEDSQYNTYYYPHIIWLMIATSKSYKLRYSDIQIIINAVAAGLHAEYRYDVNRLPEYNKSINNIYLCDAVCIWLRSIFGGTDYDCKFLKNLSERIYYTDLLVDTEEYEVDIHSIPSFDPIKHILPYAIDFHVYPHILIQLDGVLSKDAIWWCWSSINKRKCIDPYTDNIEFNKRNVYKDEFEKGYDTYAKIIEQKLWCINHYKKVIKRDIPITHWFKTSTHFKCSSV